MDYYGLLFLYYLKGLSGKSVLRLFFNIEADGTEQLLPENTSTPTTTPILADIQYPDGLRTDQYFTYRETPTTVSNKARIKTIKGNTLVWNQLVQNGNFADTSVWQTVSGASFTVSGNVANVTSTSAYGRIIQFINFISGHKYLIFADVKKSNANDGIRLYYGTQLGGGSYIFENNTNWQKLAIIKTATSSESSEYPNVEPTADNITWQQRNMMIIDLTQMGLDISSPSDFTSLFPLSYYSYNQGSLLSFNGNGIKTTGKNLNPWTGVDYIASTSRTVFLKKGDYVFSTDNGNNFEGSTQIYICLADSNGNNITSGGITSGYLSLNDSGTFYYGGYGRNNIPFTLNFDAFVSFGFNNQRPTNFSAVQLEFGSVATDYEPYTSSTLSLPISTYFPNGMKSAGSVYDELTPSKAITRIGMVDLGTLEWRRETGTSQGISYVRFRATVSDLKPSESGRSVEGLLCSDFQYFLSTGDSNYTYWKNTTGEVFFYNNAYDDSSSFKTAMSGVYLLYEVATPTETPITTEDANEALSLLMGKSVSSDNAKQMIDIITKGE